LAQAQYRGTGRRKNSTARVILVPGTGNITINKKSIEEYIPFAYLHEVIKQPLNLTETLGSYDVLVNVNGGGFTGQSGAIRHGIARALLTVDPEDIVLKSRYITLFLVQLKSILSKPGLKKARKASQFSKR